MEVQDEVWFDVCILGRRGERQGFLFFLVNGTEPTLPEQPLLTPWWAWAETSLRYVAAAEEEEGEVVVMVSVVSTASMNNQSIDSFYALSIRLARFGSPVIG